MVHFQITKLVEKDWKTYRALRLESLKDSPDSFGSTLERETEFTEKDWKSRLMPSKDPVHVLPLVALSNGKPVGLASGAVHAREATTAHIYQMWVLKSHRGLGIGRSLLNRIKAWASELQLESLSLAVTISNTEAISIYQSAGFVSFGRPQPLREGSELLVQPMVLELNRRTE